MSYQTEKQVFTKEEQPQQERSFARTMLAIMAVSFLALACVAFYTNGVGSSMASTISFRSEIGKANKRALSTVVLHGHDAFKAYDYLDGKFLTKKYRTLGHGMDENGELTKDPPFFSVDILFWKSVSKSVWRENILNERYLIGLFGGLDEQGNAVFGDGAYCEALHTPYYGVLEVLCGSEYKVSGVFMQNPCAMKITVTHPRQCGAEAVTTLADIAKDHKGTIASGNWGKNLATGK